MCSLWGGFQISTERFSTSTELSELPLLPFLCQESWYNKYRKSLEQRYWNELKSKKMTEKFSTSTGLSELPLLPFLCQKSWCCFFFSRRHLQMKNCRSLCLVTRRLIQPVGDSRIFQSRVGIFYYFDQNININAMSFKFTK